MENYYHNQISGNHFSGHYRQRGSGFGALAMGIGRVALPLARKFLIPTAKKVGRELLSQAVPELVDVFSKKKSAKSAVKNTIKNTIRKQVGRGGGGGAVKKRKRIIRKKYNRKRSRADFFSKVKHNDR